MHQSIPVGDIEFVDIQSINPGISKVQIKVCYVQNTPNRNGSIITKDFAQSILAQSLRGAPIVGHYNEEIQDFEEHNKYIDITEDGEIVFKNDTSVFGFVDVNANIWFRNFVDDDGKTREYLCTEGYIFTLLFPEANRMVVNGNNQSMELDGVTGTWTKDINKHNKFFIVNDAIIKNLCILGENTEPCFEGAQIKKEFSLDMQGVNTKLFSLMQQFAANEGGKPMYNLDEVVEYQELLGKYSALEEEFKAKEKELEDEKAKGQQASEDLEKEKEGKKESDDELEKKKKAFAALEEEVAEFSELKEKYSLLEAEAADLREFKANVIKEQKEAKIAEFDMLSEEDKADVREHFDEYSLDEIESKLAVICYRKKVSFTMQEELEKPSEEPKVYSLDESENADALGNALKEFFK